MRAGDNGRDAVKSEALVHAFLLLVAESSECLLAI